MGHAALGIVRFVVLFVLVLALAVLCTRWLGRRLSGAGGALRVLTGLRLGAASVVVVKVGRRVLVLGTSERHVEVLCTITDPEEIALLEEPAVGPRGPSFGSVLRGHLEHREDA